MDWVRILAYITGTADQELLLRNEYLAAENRILKAQLKTPLRLTDAERITLAEIAQRLGRKALEDVANVVKPDTLLGWYRRLIARKFDGSKSCRYPGRPGIDNEIEKWVVRMAKENSDWGYDRIVGAMANLGYRLSDQAVGNIAYNAMASPLRRSGSVRHHGQTSFERTWRSLQGLTFSRWKYSRCVGWSPIMYCSLSISTAAKSRRLVSRRIRMSDG